MLTPPHSHRLMRDSAVSQQFWSQSWAENTPSPRDAESRRPDYLKRATRPIPDTTLAAGTVDAEMEDRVGIAMTPVKGRRLKLFQETSEESFEESLMAGGYGRYVNQSLNYSCPMLLTRPSAYAHMGGSCTDKRFCGSISPYPNAGSRHRCQSKGLEKAKATGSISRIGTISSDYKAFPRGH
jgi:hypothetical protein